MPDIDQQSAVPNFEDIFPSADNTTEIIIYKDEDGTLARKKRSLHTAIDNFTIDGLKQSIKNIEDKEATLAGQKAFFQRLIDWAEANGIVQDAEALGRIREIMAVKEAIKQTEEIEEKKPEDFAYLKNLKQKLKDLENES